MKIYVIVAGEYSDYHIITATENEEKAKSLVELINKSHNHYGYNDASIEEYDTDDIDISLSNKDKKYFRVWSSNRNNWSINCGEVSLDDYLSYRKCNGFFTISGIPQSWEVYCSAKDEDHAKKIATDWIAKEKARLYGV